MYKKCIKRLMLLTVLFVFCMGINVFAAETEEPVTEVVTEDYTDTQTIHIHKYYKESPEVGYTVDAYVNLSFNYDDFIYSQITGCDVISSSVIKNGSDFSNYTVFVIDGGDGTEKQIYFSMSNPNSPNFACIINVHVDAYGVVELTYLSSFLPST